MAAASTHDPEPDRRPRSPLWLRAGAIAGWSAAVVAAAIADVPLSGDAGAQAPAQERGPAGRVAGVSAVREQEAAPAPQPGAAPAVSVPITLSGASPTATSGTGGGAATSSSAARGDGAGLPGTTGLSLDDGRAGVRPDIAVADAVPGTAGRTTLRVVSTRGSATPLTVTPVDVADRPGAAGGRLSGVVLLRIRDAGGRLLSAATVAGTGTVALGAVPPHATRSWTVELLLPDTGRPAGPGLGDNRLQGAGLRFALDVAAR